MAFWKSLIVRTAKQLASDPAARAKAGTLAKRVRPAVGAALRQAKAVRDAPDPAREAGRLAARLRRRFLDG